MLRDGRWLFTPRCSTLWPFPGAVPLGTSWTKRKWGRVAALKKTWDTVFLRIALGNKPHAKRRYFDISAGQRLTRGTWGASWCPWAAGARCPALQPARPRHGGVSCPSEVPGVPAPALCPMQGGTRTEPLLSCPAWPELCGEECPPTARFRKRQHALTMYYMHCWKCNEDWDGCCLLDGEQLFNFTTQCYASPAELACLWEMLLLVGCDMLAN